MTTHTPYDADIARWEARPRAVSRAIQMDDAYHLTVLRSKAEGYRQAKAEDAPLLAAAEAALADIESGFIANPSKAGERCLNKHETALRAAIKLAERGAA